MTVLIVFLIIIAISIILVVHEFGHFLIAKIFGIKVEEFGLGFPPKIIGKRFKGTLFTLNAIPFGAMVKITNGTTEDKDSFNGKPLRIRVAVMLGGILFNLILGWLIMSAVFMIGSSDAGIFIAEVTPNSPAFASGLKINDKLINVKDFQSNQILTFSKIEDFQGFVSTHTEKIVGVEIQRGNQKLNLEITPRANPPEGEGPLGIALIQAEIIKKQNFFVALFNGLKSTLNIFWQVILAILGLIKLAFLGKGSLSQLTGPVGAVQLTTQFAYLGFSYLLKILGLLSISLAATNLIPFPALDGGRLWFFLIEKIRKVPVTQKTQNIVDSLGFSLLILLSIILMVKDVKGLF